MSLKLILLISATIIFDCIALTGFYVSDDKKSKLVNGSFLLAWISSIVLFVVNWIDAGEPPMGNMYHVAVVVSASFYPFWLLLAKRNGQYKLAPFFIVAQIIFAIGSFFMWKDGWVRPPVLRSHYFIPHVTSYMISYALATVSFFIIFSAVLRSNLDKHLRIGIHLVTPTMLFLVSMAYKHSTTAIVATSAIYTLFLIFAFVMRLPSLRLASVSQFDESAYRVTLLAYPFLTIGLCLGALWAEESWGQYWSWDLKETWALITWLFYAIYLHCRRTLFFRKCSRPVLIIAYLALIVTYLAVNLMPSMASSMHSYTK